MATDDVVELSVCTVTRGPARLAALVAALGEQSAGPETFELILVDASVDGLAVPSHPDVTVQVLRADATTTDAALLDRAWRAAHGPSVAFLAPDLVPAPLWIEAMQRQLRRGRRVVSGSWLPLTEDLPQAGPASSGLWALNREVPVATLDQLGCLRADLEAIGGVPAIADPDVRDAELAARLVEAGADRSWARHAVVFHPVTSPDLTSVLAERRDRTVRMLATLDEHPRARAHLMPAGVLPHRRHVEVLALVAGLLLAPRNRRAGLLALPWLYERGLLTPRAGGARRRWVVLPGVLAVDLHDAITALVARLRPRQPR